MARTIKAKTKQAAKSGSPKPSSRPTVMVSPDTCAHAAEEAVRGGVRTARQAGRTSAACEEGIPPDETNRCRSHFPSFILGGQ